MDVRELRAEIRKDRSNLEPETAPLLTWTDDDDESLRQVLAGLERIAVGVTAFSNGNLLANPKPRKMTIKDAQEIAAAYIPTLRRLKQKLDDMSHGR